MKDIVRRCHVVYVVIGVVVVASGSSPSAYILGLIRRIDRGDLNDIRGSIEGLAAVFRLHRHVTNTNVCAIWSGAIERSD